MTIHHFSHHTASASLVQGEVAMPHAPKVVLANGHCFIPQHYLRYQHTAQTIQHIISDIDYERHVLLFAAEDDSGMYIQVGLVGRENYDRTQHIRPQKLVYGRKWRINRDTPTSEIIQTAFLAIKKAREHEVRELLTIIDAQTRKMSTPFSNHHDLPLLAHNRHVVLSPVAAAQTLDMATVSDFLQGVLFAERRIEVVQVEQRRHGQYLVDLSLGVLPLIRQVEGDMHEYDSLDLTLILKTPTRATLLYALMDALIAHSDSHVEAQFSYQQYHRFSRDNDPAQIAALSIASRPYVRDARNKLFSTGFQQSNYEVDASRVPHLGTGKLAQKNIMALAAFDNIQGHLPNGYQFKSRYYV